MAVLYTPLALEDVFSQDDPQEAVNECRMVRGRWCLIRKEPSGARRIERLLSTDPADFLEDTWMPGQPVGF